MNGTTRSSVFRVLVGLSLLLGLQASKAQNQPPNMPTNLISPLVPFDQGLANIQAQDAARQKAVQPVPPGAASGSPQTSTSPLPNQPDPATGAQTPQPR
jgi:hypothetical protein